MKRNSSLILLIVISLVLAACAGNSEANNNKVTIGYFPNLTHVATIIALENDYFADSLGEAVDIETKTVNPGGLFMAAMATGSIDVGTVGPRPLLNHYVKEPLYYILSAAVNGGAVLVGSKHSQITE